MDGQALAHLPAVLGEVETRVMAVYRGDDVIIPEGATVLRSEDIVFFLGLRKYTATVMAQFHHVDEPCRRVMIAGGGNIGMLLARKLERFYQVKIIETRGDRADELA